MTTASVVSVQVGAVAPLGPGHTRSAFIKTPVAGPVRARTLGLDGDAQADPRVHGGPDMAVYGYAMSRYPLWQAAFPRHAALLVPGGMGENLTIAGQDEASVCLGDSYRIGAAVLQVCQPRQPCFKFALRFDDPLMPKAMTRNGFSGWYFRVLEEGDVGPGAAVALIDRPHPEWSMARFLGVLADKRPQRAELEELAILDGLADAWRLDATRKLGATG